MAEDHKEFYRAFTEKRRPGSPAAETHPLSPASGRGRK
jgi:hypothetical protein